MVCRVLLPLQVKGSDYMVLDSYCKFVTTAAKFLDINIGQKYTSVTVCIAKPTSENLTKVGLACEPVTLATSLISRPESCDAVQKNW